MTGAKHIWEVRVYYEDTDHGGVVYHANYLKYMERARTEMLRSAGIELDILEQQEGILFAVTRLSIQYSRPAGFNDLLAVESSIREVAGVRITFRQRILNRQQKLVEADVVVACINHHGKPVRIPGCVLEQLISQGVVRDE